MTRLRRVVRRRHRTTAALVTSVLITGATACTAAPAAEPEPASVQGPHRLRKPTPVPLDCDGMTWTMKHDHYFEFGSAELSAPAHTRLQKCAPRVAHHLRRPGHRVRVDGYADGVGTEPNNLILSKDRATTIARALGWHGPGDSRFVIKGHGEALTEDEQRDPARRVVVVTLT